jgi:hypothetical protein
MIVIDAPKSVARGEVLKGLVEVNKSELDSARMLEIGLYNSIKYGRLRGNYSSWEMKKTFSAQEARNLFELPFEFLVDKRAPITYRGKKIRSRWELRAKVDVAGGLDKEKRAEIIILR